MKESKKKENVLDLFSDLPASIEKHLTAPKSKKQSVVTVVADDVCVGTLFDLIVS